MKRRKMCIRDRLTGENANEKNLITGTRYLNVDGMLPFENMVADYIKETNNHVLYRVTPVFSGDNLVASGVQMEAKSVEDNGDGILFNVYCFNAQPGIAIDYATGDSHQDDSIVADASKSTTAAEANVQTYVLNTNTKKFHKESCKSAKSMDCLLYTSSKHTIFISLSPRVLFLDTLVSHVLFHLYYCNPLPVKTQYAISKSFKPIH